MMQRTKKKLLITGISGQLGSNLAYCLGDRYEIAGIYFSQNVSLQGIETKRFDLRQKIDLEQLFDSWIPDVVIHAAAYTNVDACEEYPQLAEDLNIKATDNIVDALGASSTKFIYISTDSVYAGDKGAFTEQDPTDPQNVYGRTKLAGERIALARSGSLALRTNFFGWGIIGKLSLAQWGVAELSAGHVIPGFTDVFFSSLYTSDMARLVEGAIEKDLAGVYNFGSSSSLSKYDFLVSLARKFGLDETKVRPTSVEEGILRAKRGKNLSLNMKKLKNDLGMKIPSMEEGINHFFADSQRNCLRVMQEFVARRDDNKK